MVEIFRIKGTDKRNSFVKKLLAKTQKIAGKDVEYFSDETGFVLLQKEAPIKYDNLVIQRALSAAMLSQKAPRELREFYYTLRTTPKLVKPFAGSPDNIYPMTLDAINNLEILCDIYRDTFTMGNLSKGFIYYYHSPVFGHKERKVAFTEVIARTIMDPTKEVDYFGHSEWECNDCENIIVVEKNAAANRLVELGISEFTNSIIVTVGGNFSRAIWELTDRFKDKKNIVFLADADAYGVDMLRTIQVGTESSRHLPYKFNPKKYDKIYLAGFYPSVGETLGLPNDVEQKRPLQNPYVKQRINFLMAHGLLNPQDYQTWANDKTYELESLSAGFENEKGEPIGLGIYLVEYMRLFGIPVKPPMPPDDKLKEEFDKAAIEELTEEIFNELSYPAIYWKMDKMFREKKEELKQVILEDLLPRYKECLKEVTAKEIKYHIWKQFEEDPKRASYDLKAIAHKLKTKFNIDIDWDTIEYETKCDEWLNNWEGPGFTTDVEFEPIHNESNYEPNGYDLIEKRIGAKDEDIEKVRKALLLRFKEDPRLKEGLDD
jgi:hypothetical protein